MPTKSKSSKKSLTFKEHFEQEIIPELQKSLKFKNRLAVPRVQKVNVHVGIGGFYNQNKDFSAILKNISLISGQKPVVTKSRKAISNFKLRIGMPSGVDVTLRGKRMYDFLNKLINVVCPRMRDFRGLALKGFDGKGNYNIGIKEFTIFPEIKVEDVVKNHGIQITIVTSAKDDESGKELLTKMGFPFQKK